MVYLAAMLPQQSDFLLFPLLKVLERNASADMVKVNDLQMTGGLCVEQQKMRRIHSLI